MKRRSKKSGVKGRFMASVVVAVLIVSAVFFWMNANGIRIGMRQVKSFKPDGVCLPTTDPKCGYCPGEVIDNTKCYVKYGELEKYE